MGNDTLNPIGYVDELLTLCIAYADVSSNVSGVSLRVGCSVVKARIAVNALESF